MTDMPEPRGLPVIALTQSGRRLFLRHAISLQDADTLAHRKGCDPVGTPIQAYRATSGWTWEIPWHPESDPPAS